MTRRAKTLLTLLTAAALALPAASTAHRSDLPACDMISSAKLAAILGVEHVQILKALPGTSSVDNVSGVTHSVCNGVAWSGTPPSTQSGALRALSSGRGAAFALDNWAPDEASKYVNRWKSKGFDALTLGTSWGVITLPGLPPFKPFHLHRLLPTGGKPGKDGAIGVTGSPSGALSTIRVAAGTWWSYPSSAIVSIAFGGSARNPTVTQLNQIAQVAVTAFGVKPLRLH